MLLTEERFTREELKTAFDNYMDLVTKLDPADYEASSKSIEDVFTDDYICRQDDWPIIRNKAEWINILINDRPQYKFKLYYEKPDGYLIIDTRRGMIVGFIREEYIHRATGKICRSFYLNMHIQFARDTEGNVKVYREAVSKVPSLFQVDHLEVGKEGLPCWMYLDYDNNF